MTTVAVASGKGGAGKTSFAAALAVSLGCVVADCDVDAANLAIALGARLESREDYRAGPGYSIDAAACAGCGECAASCRFAAIRPVSGSRAFRIVEELCERCAACLPRCPTGAITATEKRAGELFMSTTRDGQPLAHAALVPGEDTSGKLVRMVRERAAAVAGTDGTVVVDAPPGIGCPVIASLSGCDLVVVLVEASSSGTRDAARLLELVASMRREAVGVVNKTGLDAEMDGRATALLSAAGVPILGEIPFDPGLRSVEERGRTWLDAEGDPGDAVRRAIRAVASRLEAGCPSRADA